MNHIKNFFRYILKYCFIRSSESFRLEGLQMHNKNYCFLMKTITVVLRVVLSITLRQFKYHRLHPKSFKIKDELSNLK